MCIGVYTLEHPDYALILATNRDEFLHRPTEDAHWHAFESATSPVASTTNTAPTTTTTTTTAAAAASTTATAAAETVLPAQGPATAFSFSSSTPGPILSGRDLQAGGTWLGLTRAGGRVALLTNITEPLAKWKVSRGELVAGFLTMGTSTEDERERGAAERESDVWKRWEDKMGVNRGGGMGEYAGFNLLLLAPRVESESQAQLRLQLQSPDGEGVSKARRRVVYDARFVTNHGGGGPIASRALSAAERRCGGISNGVDHSRVVGHVGVRDSQSRRTGHDDEGEVTNDAADEWPKVRRARGDFARLLQVQEDKAEKGEKEEEMTEDELVERLFGVLEWHPSPTPVAHRGELRNTVHVLPLHIRLAIAANNDHPPQNLVNTATPAATPDIKAAQTDATVPAPGSVPAPTGETSTPADAQGSTAGLAPGQGSEPTGSTTKLKANSETETTPAFYGTRLATVVLIPRDPAREALFIERDIWALGAGGPDFAGGQDLRDSGAGSGPVRVDKSRQRVFRFRMDFGDGEL